MGIIQSTLTNEYQPSDEDLTRLADLKNRPIDYSDIPELSDDEVADIKRQLDEGRNKRMFSLRLSNSTIEWWRNTIGAGYTTAMGKLLDAARRHPEWIKESLKIHS